MPKVMYNPEKVQKQKKIIGIVSIVLILIVTILSMIFHLNIITWILLDLVIFAVANLLLRRVGKTPL
ncbi:MAG: hypothetical protein FWC14_02900 [Candidatus Bathyarchaeota archaeon]|uniref:hypothetical protein n=1 Tax=Candidatus Bathycorpusculum sp. TaxID=2994959 RepID=UPI00283051C6|nr:hypothetical protein [Candidatus Termiticorpusculum sp.]MCL2292718.1 hypothetical protein [Candidatus Termiticorpusculum sp.]